MLPALMSYRSYHIIKRIRKLLARTGYLIEQRGYGLYLAEADLDSAARCICILHGVVLAHRTDRGHGHFPGSGIAKPARVLALREDTV